MDGKVVIGTALDTQDLDKQLKFLQRQLTQYEKEAEKLSTTKAKIQVDLQGYEEAKAQIQAMTNKTLEQAQTTQQVNFVLESEQMQLEELNQKYSKQFEQISEIDRKIEDNGKEQEILKGKVEETTRALERQKQSADMKDAINGVGKEMNNVINKVGRWALAVFGVRSAYMFIRQAMSTLLQYDDQMATNVEYMRYMLASALKPLIETLINLAYQLLMYLNQIAQAWFGINLFANATTEEFTKQKKAMGGTAKEAKELKKTLAGFDEMNILQEDGSTKVGGGGGGITMPNLPSMENVKIPEWMQWIIDHKDEIIAVLTGIATAIGLINAGVGLFMSFGIGLIVAGLAYAILSIIDYLNDPSFENFGKTIQGIGGAIVGLGVVASSVFAGLVGGVVLIWGTVIKYWTEIKTFIEGIYTWFEERIEDVEQVFGKDVANIYKIIVKSGRESLELFSGVIANLKTIFNGIITFFQGVFTGDWKKAWNGLAQIVTGIFNIMVINAKGVLSNIGSIINIWVNGVVSAIKFIINTAITSIENMINFPIQMLNGFGDILRDFGVNIGRLPYVRIPRLAKGGIINMPGRGVPVGSAIAGERGAEGVIPLTDSQQMDLLGASIGKHITINANITNTMNGRVISKELQKIQAENDFAYNR